MNFCTSRTWFGVLGTNVIILVSGLASGVLLARMLGAEGWKPTAEEALEAGLIQWIAPHDKLAEETRRIAQEWVVSGAVRSFRGGSERDELKAINASESAVRADAFLSAPFIKAQFEFLWSKKKWGPAAMFLTMLISRPLWSRLL